MQYTPFNPLTNPVDVLPRPIPGINGFSSIIGFAEKHRTFVLLIKLLFEIVHIAGILLFCDICLLLADILDIALRAWWRSRLVVEIMMWQKDN